MMEKSEKMRSESIKDNELDKVNGGFSPKDYTWTCDKCGAWNLDSEQVCRSCGGPR